MDVYFKIFKLFHIHLNFSGNGDTQSLLLSHKAMFGRQKPAVSAWEVQMVGTLNWVEEGSLVSIFQGFFRGDKAPWSLSEGCKGLWSVEEESVEQTCQLKEDQAFTDVEAKKCLLEQMGLCDVPYLQLLIFCFLFSQFCFEALSFLGTSQEFWAYFIQTQIILH